MEFKDRLRELRNSKDLTQAELADAIKTTKQAISQYERGIRRPDFETLDTLCDYFNVSSDYMLGKSDITVRLVNAEEIKILDGNMPKDDIDKTILESFKDLSDEQKKSALDYLNFLKGK